MLARKPWPPVYPPRGYSHLHPAEAHYSYAYARYNGQHQPRVFKEQQHYFLAPYYRNVMPPPPRPLVEQPRRRAGAQVHDPPCRCKSKSLEDVREVVVDVGRDYDEDFNGNRVFGRERRREKSQGDNGKSMDNLTVDVGGGYPSPRRVGSYQVCGSRVEEEF